MGHSSTNSGRTLVSAQASPGNRKLLAPKKNDLRSFHFGDTRAIEGTVRIPLGLHDDPKLTRRPTRRVILFSDHGYASSLAAATLRTLGFTRTADVVGGFQAWADAGLPVKRKAKSVSVTVEPA